MLQHLDTGQPPHQNEPASRSACSSRDQPALRDEPALRDALAAALRRHGPALLTGALVALWLVLALRSLQFFSMKDDEGTFLLTAQTVREGHALYRDIWFNYLPGLIGLVLAAFRVGGVNVEAPRVLMVLFAALSLGGAAALAAASGRRWAAPVVVALLMLAPNWVQMSRSVMGEVPANALCTLALLAMLRYHRQPRAGWLAAAGALLGASIAVKYPTGIVLGVAGLDLLLLLLRQRTPWPRVLARLALLGLSAVAVVALALLPFDLRAAWGQVAGSYRAASDIYVVDVPANLARVLAYFGKNNLALVPAGLLGLGLWLGERRPGSVLLTLWLGLTLVAMLLSAPLGDHHLYLLQQPMTILAAVALAAAPDLLRRGLARHSPAPALLGLSGAACLLALVWWSPAVLERTYDRLRPRPDDHPAEREAVAALQAHTLPGDLVVCDWAMITFRAGRSAPPALVNTADLRFIIGEMDAARSIAALEASQPAAIAFWEQKLVTFCPEVLAWVDSRYVLLQRDEAAERQGDPIKLHAIYLRPDRQDRPDRVP